MQPDKFGDLKCRHKITRPPIQIQIAELAVRRNRRADDAEKTPPRRVKNR